MAEFVTIVTTQNGTVRVNPDQASIILDGDAIAGTTFVVVQGYGQIEIADTQANVQTLLESTDG